MSMLPVISVYILHDFVYNCISFLTICESTMTHALVQQLKAAHPHLTDDQFRVAVVLTRMLNLTLENEDFANDFAIELDAALDNIAYSDGFGTERQCDPRGDGRNGDWHMGCVEGVDEAEARPDAEDETPD